MEQLIPLRTEADFDAALQESFTGPVFILKHSRTCGVSQQAYDELTDWLGGRTAPARSYLVTIQTDRAVSAVIAARVGVRHESPQVLVLRDGQVTWFASHFRVTPTAIAKAIDDTAA